MNSQEVGRCEDETPFDRVLSLQDLRRTRELRHGANHLVTHKVFGNQEYNRCKSTSNAWSNNPLSTRLDNISRSRFEMKYRCKDKGNSTTVPSPLDAFSSAGRDTNTNECSNYQVLLDFADNNLREPTN
jgi:cell division protein FtsL